METDFPPDLLKNLSVYQDLVLAGRTVRPGQRDCAGRWELLDANLPRRGTILDVGSNFGWFGLRISQTRPACVVASLEADLRSAEVQRQVLASNDCRRVCLLTARAGRAVVRRLERAGQRLDAVLCLSVLHWIPDHREFLTALGRIAGRMLIEHPDPREQGAGVEAIRCEIGHIGDYLAQRFPDRPIRRLARWPSHRDGRYPRELWLVGEPFGWSAEPSAGLDVSALLDCAPGWPARSWWGGQADSLAPAERGLLFTPCGLSGAMSDGLRRRLRRLPESTAFSPGRRLLLEGRRIAGNVLRRVKIR